MLIKPVAAFISSFFICAYFFPALTFAHRAFCARLIRLRAAADMVFFAPTA